MEKSHAMPHEGYHDKEVVGSFFDSAREQLTLVLTHQEALIFSGVIQLELNFFSDQNVLFDIHRFTMDSVPSELVADYPFLASYASCQRQLLIYYLHSSVGMTGVVVCSVAKPLARRACRWSEVLLSLS